MIGAVFHILYCSVSQDWLQNAVFILFTILGIKVMFSSSLMHKFNPLKQFIGPPAQPEELREL